MKNELQKLPLSIQSFEDLRTNNYLYVDKTKEILKLVNLGKSFFYLVQEGSANHY